MTNEVTLSAVLSDGGTFQTTKRGISPLLDILETDPTFLQGAVCTDKIVGKAAAMLFVRCGVKSVHGEVMSEAGDAFLTAYRIPHTFDRLTPFIVNRRGDGMCPMEETVLSVDDPQTAETLLRQKVAQLKKEMSP